MSESDEASSSSSTSQLTASGPSSSSQASNAGARKRRAVFPQLSRINFGSSSQSADSGSASAPPTGSGSEDEGSADEAGDKRIRLSSSSSTASSQSVPEVVGRSNSSSPAPDSGCFDAVDLECSQGAHRPNPIAKESVIGDGEFELVGDGKECKAVHIPTRTIRHCQVLNEQEFRAYQAIAARLELAALMLQPEQYDELRRLILPKETRVVRGERNSLYYVISPDHYCNLQTMLSLRGDRDEAGLTEQQSRLIFSQIVRLVHYCHTVGVYFRDFKLKKVVFVERNCFDIRFMFVVQDMHVAPTLGDDEVEQQKVCPVFTAPEMMPSPNSKRHTYRGGPADVWSLGIFLFQILTGRPPFMGRTPRELFGAIRENKVRFLPRDRVSAPARVLVYGLLRSQPAERPLPEDVLAAEWVRMNRDNPVPHCLHVRHSAHGLHAPANVSHLLGLAAADRNAIYHESPQMRNQMLEFIHDRADQLTIRHVQEHVVPDVEAADFMVPDALGLYTYR